MFLNSFVYKRGKKDLNTNSIAEKKENKDKNIKVTVKGKK
jgi:hypothetical protein